MHHRFLGKLQSPSIVKSSIMERSRSGASIVIFASTHDQNNGPGQNTPSTRIGFETPYGRSRKVTRLITPTWPETMLVHLADSSPDLSSSHNQVSEIQRLSREEDE